ncbi:glycine cleavage system protein GcvH [Jatrophihabitans telluris]|uniref:Glycine cleavage system H protein n=1 Tax=Jatrophihabitans telluris TaxID=2038343 RepID=A0ABY4R2U8_9ACTN|nr:glycine cleavage system protein GcvH [Jatrophihabitans telluris]UQX90134.1 glycine cleavage system protein GcvH [Jatrophihabitans telluris]
MSEIPDDLRYTADHEWAKLIGENTVRIGITDYAQSSLGDIVFVSVHEVGGSVVAGETFGEVESTKSVSDLFAPLSGTVAARNEQLEASPELVNSDPYGNGWIAEIEVADPTSLDALLDPSAYRAATAE